MEFMYRLKGCLDLEDKNVQQQMHDQCIMHDSMISSITVTPLCYLKTGITQKKHSLLRTDVN